MKNKSNPFLGFIAFVAVVVLIIGCNAYTHIEHTITATICSKEQVSTGNNGGHEYRMYSNKGTFVIKDSHWPFTWRTNSSEVYGRLHTPGTYKITYIGIRFSLFSYFHNIMKYKRIADDRAAIASC